MINTMPELYARVVQTLRASENFYAESSLWYDQKAANATEEAADIIEKQHAAIAKRDAENARLRAEVAKLRAKIANALDALNEDNAGGAHLILYDASK